MTMSAFSQRGVFGATGWVFLHGDASPVVDGIDD